MTATRGLGTLLKITTKTVAELTQIGGLDLTADTIDVTTLDSDGGYKKFIAGFKDAGDVSISGFFDPSTGSGQDDLYAAFESGETSAFTIEFPASLKAKWTFDGVVTGFKTNVDLDGPIGFEGTIKVSGKPTLDITP